MPLEPIGMAPAVILRMTSVILPLTPTPTRATRDESKSRLLLGAHVDDAREAMPISRQPATFLLGFAAGVVGATAVRRMS